MGRSTGGVVALHEIGTSAVGRSRAERGGAVGGFSAASSDIRSERRFVFAPSGAEPTEARSGQRRQCTDAHRWAGGPVEDEGRESEALTLSNVDSRRFRHSSYGGQAARTKPNAHIARDRRTRRRLPTGLGLGPSARGSRCAYRSSQMSGRKHKVGSINPLGPAYRPEHSAWRDPLTGSYGPRVSPRAYAARAAVSWAKQHHAQSSRERRSGVHRNLG